MNIRARIVRWLAWCLRLQVTDAVDWETLDHADLMHYLDDRLDEQQFRARDPVETLEELPDEDGAVYYWGCESEQAAEQTTMFLTDYFEHTLGRDPRAAHVVATDIEDLRRLDPEELQRVTQPFDAGRGEARE